MSSAPVSRRGLLRGALALGLAGPACGEGAPPLELRGAGATLPHPLYASWIALHRRVAPRVRIDYQGVGSAAGLRQVLFGMADFAASDAPLRSTPFEVLHVPTAVVAVGLVHHLPGVTAPLRLGPRALGAIFEGRVRSWTDPRIARDNPGLELPDLPLVPVHRSDGSGATQVFSEWLAREAAREGLPPSIHPGMLARFPSGVGARGNDGVARVVSRLPGAIGYVEVAHARRARLPSAMLLAREGAEAVAPTSITIAAAAASAPDALDIDVGQVDPPEGAYPLTTFTYLVVPREIPDARRGTALARFLFWILGPGQAECEGLGYQALPPLLASRARERVVTALRSAGAPALRLD